MSFFVSCKKTILLADTKINSSPRQYEERRSIMNFSNLRLIESTVLNDSILFYNLIPKSLMHKNTFLYSCNKLLIQNSPKSTKNLEWKLIIHIRIPIGKIVICMPIISQTNAPFRRYCVHSHTHIHTYMHIIIKIA